MNKLAYTAFVAFCASITTLAGVYLLMEDPAAANPPAALRIITTTELARHDSRESCWKAIHGKVYDVTDYIPAHPTPASVILRWCGKDSTEAWETKGRGRSHTPRAEALLDEYLIGHLVESAE